MNLVIKVLLDNKTRVGVQNAYTKDKVFIFSFFGGRVGRGMQYVGFQCRSTLKVRTLTALTCMQCSVILPHNHVYTAALKFRFYRGADKSLARPDWKNS